ncbi:MULTISPECIES: hypothetical protein [unclassified Streptomyces]|uniref:hypothetical protein n=1 Tax=unclassified Streptomyces TaxID=2593676 RepID=UPI0038636363|nr:hypothetical protein OG569_40895 [Streptomyces sp. NBC_00827]
MQGRQTGPFVLFRDGKVVGHEAVRDDVTMLGQLGIFLPSPATALRMLAWRVTGKAARAAVDVTTKAAEAAAGLLRENPGQSH